MHIWKYYGVTHRDHLICNPTSEAKLDELVELLPLKSGARILDIACGKGEQLLRIARRHDANGVGVDISPYEVREANRRITAGSLEGQVEIIEGDGAKFSVLPNSFDLAMCLGASWIWDGYRGTIEALKGFVRPGGLVAIGEPFKLKEPDAGYVEAAPGFAENLVTHAENVATAQQAGLTPLYNLVSNQDDWDRYEGQRMLSAEMYAAENPDDPDVRELLERQRRGNGTFLKWGRDTTNWAIYLFKAP